MKAASGAIFYSGVSYRCLTDTNSRNGCLSVRMANTMVHSFLAVATLALPVPLFFFNFLYKQDSLEGCLEPEVIASTKDFLNHLDPRLVILPCLTLSADA